MHFFCLTLAHVFLLICASLQLSGCSGHGGSIFGGSTSIASGVVQLARVNGATIRIYAMLESGDKGTLISETTTNSNGEYTASLGGYRGTVIIESLGGSYNDEATGLPSSVDAELILSSIVDSNQASNAPITPMSTLVKERIVAQLASKTLDEAKTTAVNEVAGLFGLEPEDLEAIPTAPDADSSSDLAGLRASLALAAFSFLAKDFRHGGNPVSLKEIMDVLIEDLKGDGKVIGNISSGGAAAGLGNSLAFQWKSLIEDGKNQAKTKDGLVFEGLDNSIWSSVSSTVINSGADASLDGIIDGVLYIDGVDTGLTGGTGVFLDKFYVNGTQAGTFDLSSQTVTVTGPLATSINSNKNFIIQDSLNGAALTTSGSVRFTGFAINYGTVAASAVFLGSSSNHGTVSGDAIFSEDSFNDIDGIVLGNSSFNDNSWNKYGTIAGNATFNDNSYNDSGVVNGNANFYDSSIHNPLASILGNASFFESSSCMGTVHGIVTYYTAGICNCQIGGQ